jgi:hypothetical protein
MGNTVPGEGFFAGGAPIAPGKQVKAGRKGLWQLGPLRRLLQKLNEWSFARLYRQ